MAAIWDTSENQISGVLLMVHKYLTTLTRLFTTSQCLHTFSHLGLLMRFQVFSYLCRFFSASIPTT